MIIHAVEQGTFEWHQLRLGRVTSTNFKKAISDSYLELIDELIAEEETGMSDDIDFISPDMQRGIDYEPLAARQYEQMKGVKCDQVGFITSTEYPFLGVSPDRCIGKEGVLEIKCPKSKTHIRYIRMNKVPSDYFSQCLVHFIVNTDLEWVDFMSYDPRVERKPVFLYRTERGDIEKEIESATKRLDRFAKKLSELKDRLFF